MFYTRIRSFSRQRLFPSMLAIALILSGLILPGAFGARPAAALLLLVVNSIADTGGSTCSTTCTLRQAVTVANAAGYSTVINFGVSGTIVFGTPLLIDNVGFPIIIDGSGQSISISGGNNTLAKNEG